MSTSSIDQNLKSETLLNASSFAHGIVWNPLDFYIPYYFPKENNVINSFGLRNPSSEYLIFTISLGLTSSRLNVQHPSCNMIQGQEFIRKYINLNYGEYFERKAGGWGLSKKKDPCNM